MTDCLKDCYNLHKWETIKLTLEPINFTEAMSKQEYTEVATMGAQACAGGSCEVGF
jgi:ribonucleoside-diphosphate reductase alpha chain